MGRPGIRSARTSRQSACVLSRIVRPPPGRCVKEQSIVDVAVSRCRQARFEHRTSRESADKTSPRARTSDDRRRWTAYRAILDGTVNMESPVERCLAEMLFFSLSPGGGLFDSVAAGLDALNGEVFTDELRRVIDIAFDSARRSTYELGSLVPELAKSLSSYMQAIPERKSFRRSGLRHCVDSQHDAGGSGLV